MPGLHGDMPALPRVGLGGGDDVIRPTFEVWGQWDDYCPYYVLADYYTIEEAAQVLEAAHKGWGGPVCKAVPSSEVPQPSWVVVHDCEFDGPLPCDNPLCRHGHLERVFVFEMEQVCV